VSGMEVASQVRIELEILTLLGRRRVVS